MAVLDTLDFLVANHSSQSNRVGSWRRRVRTQKLIWQLLFLHVSKAVCDLSIGELTILGSSFTEQFSLLVFRTLLLTIVSSLTVCSLRAYCYAQSILQEAQPSSRSPLFVSLTTRAHESLSSAPVILSRFCSLSRHQTLCKLHFESHRSPKTI